MADFGPLGGVKITGFISPTDTNDNYAVIDPLYGIGGFRVLSGGTSDLDAIPQLRRREGMYVGVSGGTAYYKLLPEGGGWSFTSADWLLTDLGSSGSTDTFISGMTFNNGTYDLTVHRNDGTDFTQSLSILASDMVVTGGTYQISTGVVTFTTNSGGTFNVSGFTSGMTDSYTSTAYTVGNEIRFDNNIQGSNLYNVDLTPVLSGFTTGSTSPFQYNPTITTAIQPVIGNNTALGDYSSIGGGQDNTIVSGNTGYSVITGGESNVINENSFGSFIGSGNDNAIYNNSHYSFIGTGWYNRIGGYYGTIIGGYSNVINGTHSFIGSGYYNTINSGSSRSTIIGGNYNTINHSDSHIIGSNITSVSANTTHVENLNIGVIGGTAPVGLLGVTSNGMVVSGSSLAGAFTHTSNGKITPTNVYGNVIGATNANYSSILGGKDNKINTGSSSNYSVVVGGYKNIVNDEYSIVVGGLNNLNSGEFSTIIGGRDNRMNNNTSFIAGGQSNIVNAGNSSIIGGNTNTINFGNSTIFGGSNNIINHNDAHIIGQGITSVSAYTTHVERFNLGSADTSTTATQVLVREANGMVNVTDLSSLTGGTGSNTFSGLTDTIVITPSDGDYLVYSGDNVINITEKNVVFTATTSGQTIFSVLTDAPLNDTQTQLFVNGVKQTYTSDYIITGGTDVVWVTNKHALDMDDELEIIYL